MTVFIPHSKQGFLLNLKRDLPADIREDPFQVMYKESFVSIQLRTSALDGFIAKVSYGHIERQRFRMKPQTDECEKRFRASGFVQNSQALLELPQSTSI